MRNLRKYLDRILLILILMFLWILLCGVILEKMIARNNVKPQRPVKKQSEIVIPIIFMACNPKFVSQSLESLITFRGYSSFTFPIFVIIECNNKVNNKIIKKYTYTLNLTSLFVPNPTSKVGRHYKFALNYAFRTLKCNAAIVIDDYLDISRDFFEYFLATYYLFEKDTSIWCVSAWNDNCKNGLVEQTEVKLLHRTDHFPGMGWMIQSKTWEEIERFLPEVFPDNFLNTVIPRGHVCIRPEMSRTYNIEWYNKERRLSDVNEKRFVFNTGFVDFTKLDLFYLLQKHEHKFVSFVYSCPEVTLKDVVSDALDSSLNFVRIPYSNVQMFTDTAKTLGLMEDYGRGIFRTALHGIVQCFIKGRRVFLAPTLHNITTPTHPHKKSDLESVWLVPRN